MINVIIPFQIQPESVKEGIALIEQFVRQVSENEPETIFYKSFQDQKEPTKFVHVMSFANDTAQLKHKQSDYCTNFVKGLYPICLAKPEAKLYTEIN